MIITVRCTQCGATDEPLVCGDALTLKVPCPCKPEEADGPAYTITYEETFVPNPILED